VPTSRRPAALGAREDLNDQRLVVRSGDGRWSRRRRCPVDLSIGWHFGVLQDHDEAKNLTYSPASLARPDERSYRKLPGRRPVLDVTVREPKGQDRYLVDPRRLLLFAFPFDTFDVDAHASIVSDLRDRPDFTFDGQFLSESWHRAESSSILVGPVGEADEKRVCRRHLAPLRSLAGVVPTSKKGETTAYELVELRTTRSRDRIATYSKAPASAPPTGART